MTATTRYPSERSAWSLVALLTVAYIFSYTDRTILGLLIEPVKADLQLTDTQLGLLLGPAFGILYATMGLPFGWLSDRWTQAGRRDAPLMIMIYGALIMTPLYLAAPLMPDPVIAFIVLTTGGIGMMMLTAVSVTALLNITPAAIRAQVIAIYYMTISLTGLFIGPTMVGYLSQHVFGEERLNLAVATMPLLFGAFPLVIIPFTRRLYTRRMQRLAGTELVA